MSTKQQGIDPKEAANEAILKHIVQYEKDIKVYKENLKQLEEAKKFLLQEAIDKKITTAGQYKLTSKEKITDVISAAQLFEVIDIDEFLSLAKITKKDAALKVKPQVLASCTEKKVSTIYKVIEMYEPGGIDKCTR